MTPCGPVISVTGELWELWERRRGEDAAALKTLETRYRSLAVALVGTGEVQRGRLGPLQSCLFVTRTPSAVDEVHLKLDRPPGRARAVMTACKIDRNLQVRLMAEVRFAQRSVTHKAFRRTLTDLENQLVSVCLVNLSPGHAFDFRLVLQPPRLR